MYSLNSKCIRFIVLGVVSVQKLSQRPVKCIIMIIIMMIFTVDVIHYENLSFEKDPTL